jgi:tRNA-Thr(GGU) m(6)t(6)A37 methyltransferase TsaA
MKPVGVIHSPFTEKSQTLIQPTRSHAFGYVDVFPNFAEGLRDLEGFSHSILLYAFHKADNYALRVEPFLDNQLRGLFTTRYPCRPNPISLSIVRLLASHENTLEIEGEDVLDGTPRLDIKPSVPEFDVCNHVKNGWYAKQCKE